MDLYFIQNTKSTLKNLLQKSTKYIKITHIKRRWKIMKIIKKIIMWLIGIMLLIMFSGMLLKNIMCVYAILRELPSN